MTMLEEVEEKRNIEEEKYKEIAKRDYEREIYMECDKEDRKWGE